MRLRAACRTGSRWSRRWRIARGCSSSTGCSPRWAGVRYLSRPTTSSLSGERRLVECVLQGTLIELAERVAGGCDECARGECTTNELRPPARGVLQLLSLLGSLDRPARDPYGDAGERSH